MSTDTRNWRPIILLLVLVFHAAIVLVALRAARTAKSSSTSRNAPLTILLLPREIRAPDTVIYLRRAAKPSSATVKPRTPDHSSATDNSTSVSPEAPPPVIDWEQEAKLATQNVLSNTDKENSYRDLSALSPEQLSWVRGNHLEPAAPGIPWKYRLVEVTKGGFPIIHINDHCVAIPFLMMMVFCKIGHIEPKGDLFEHMRDPRDP